MDINLLEEVVLDQQESFIKKLPGFFVRLTLNAI